MIATAAAATCRRRKRVIVIPLAKALLRSSVIGQSVQADSSPIVLHLCRSLLAGPKPVYNDAARGLTGDHRATKRRQRQSEPTRLLAPGGKRISGRIAARSLADRPAVPRHGLRVRARSRRPKAG